MCDHPKLILASRSPYRRELLERLGMPFECAPADLDETPLAGETPVQLVERLAVEKARAIASHYPNALVIGSDQVADHGGEIVGKPADYHHAVKQLQQASGELITLYTGLALLNTNTDRVQKVVVPFRVKFKQLDDALIERYLEKEQPYGCCGSLRADGLGIALLEYLEGDDPNTLIGLPLIKLVEFLLAEDFAVV